LAKMDERELTKLVQTLRKEMVEAAKGLEFEKAAQLRDRIRSYEQVLLGGSP
ncbi:MAG: excinuclease ABC subunit B, partial [Myxococcota bacterium]